MLEGLILLGRSGVSGAKVNTGKCELALSSGR